MTLGPYLHSAMRDAAVEPDARGLMPLRKARALVRGAATFDKGDGRIIDGRQVLDSDLLWAALLSLKDGDEFVEQACRIRWKFHPRGFDNIAPVERYGEAVLPWLAKSISRAGKVADAPWCLRPCLLALGGRTAFDLALSVRDPREPFVGRWLVRHLEGWPWLVEECDARPASKAKRAREALTAIAQADPPGTLDLLGGAVGVERAKALLEGLGISPQVDPAIEAVLAEAERVEVPAGPTLTMGLLQAHVRNFEYPMWDNTNYFTGAMRVTGFVSPAGDALVFQALVTGLGEDTLRRELHIYSPVAAYRAPWSGAFEILSERAKVGAEAKLDALGGIVVPAALSREGLDATQVEAVERELGARERVLVRLGQSFADAAFLDGEALAERAGLPAGSRVLFQFDSGFRVPRAGQAAHQCADLAAMLLALRRRRAIRRLPSGATALRGLVERIEAVGGWGDVSGA